MSLAAEPVDPAEVPDGENRFSAMRIGDFERAWAITDRELLEFCRSGSPKYDGPRHLQRIWRGEDLRDKRVLVRCYHGLGDTIQFARFLSPMRRMAREVVVWCQPELLSLIGGIAGVDQVIPLHDGVPDAAFDVDIEIMEIPHAIRARREEAEMCQSYLGAAGRHHVTRSQCRPMSVGLVWAVGDWAKGREVPALLLKRLKLPDLRLCSLQRGPAAAAATEIGAIDISTSDIEVLAGRLRELDLLVCVDTMVAHLSAALGCETWIMLHSDCDWRWPASGERTFWYPSARLFHQRFPGDWSGVVESIRSALCVRATNWRSAD